MTLSDLNRYSDDLISPSLSMIKGVAEVTVIGQKRYAVRVEVDPAKTRRYQHDAGRTAHRAESSQ